MTSRRRADLLFINGAVLTLDPQRPEAEALAIGDGQVLAVGPTAEVRPLAGPRTRVIDLAGRTATPGLADAHFHLVYYGMTSSWLDLSGAKDAGQMAGAVRRRAHESPAGAWVYGRGWDPVNLVEGRPPSLMELDAAAPRHPVLLSRQDGHLCLANSEALRRAGITRETPDPPGGAIERDGSGAPTGALSEAALYLAWNAYMAELTPDDFQKPLLEGCQAAVRAGVTSVHAVLLENVEAELEALRRMDAEDTLPMRVYAMVPIESISSLRADLLQRRGNSFRVGAAKVFSDGTLFAGTAALRSPYLDALSSRGQLAYSLEALTGLVRRAREAGLQPAIHAVGDGAVEAVLDAYAAVYGPGSIAARPRIEHATTLGPDLVRRMAGMGVVASLQARRWAQVEKRLGRERSAWANPWRALADAGVTVAAGSDAPFLQRGPGSWDALLEGMRRGLTLLEALRTVTRGPAYAAFQERELGALRPGMLGDVTVLSGDLRSASVGDLKAVTPTMTVMGGKVVWEG
jgi:predicted amidohydrolase YtcJ